MNDEERNGEQERMDADVFQTESLSENKRKSKIITCPFVLLCLLAGVMIYSCSVRLPGLGVFGLWALPVYHFIIPLILMGISCGLPYYKGKEAVGLALLLNLFLWFVGLVSMWSILSVQ